MIPPVADLCGPALWFLAAWSIRWGVLILGLALWFRVRPPRRAATRHLLCGSVLVAGLALPLAPGWTAPWPRWGWVVPDRPAPASIAAAPDARPEPIRLPVETEVEVEPIRPALGALSASRSAPATRPIPHASPARPIEFGRAIPLVLGLIWLIGSLVVLARLAVGWWSLSRLRRAASPLVGPSRATFDQARRAAVPSRRRIEAATHPAVGSPIALGGWSPVILLPTTWDTWTEADQRAALLHELAHLARGDDAWKLAAELIRAPFWFHPGVAWLTARLDREAELAADEATIALGIPPRDLARLLLDCARKPHRLAPDGWLRPRSALSFFTKATVSTRINRLLEDDMPLSLTRPSKLHQLGLGSLIAAFALAIGGAHGGAIEPPRPPETAPARPASQQPQPQADPAPLVIARDLRGQLTDAAGAPIEGARLVARTRQQFHQFQPVPTSATTDAEGRFRLEKLADGEVIPAQAGITLEIRLRDGREFDLPTATRPDGLETLVKLPTLLDGGPAGPDPVAADEVAGVVVDPQGRPIAGVEVKPYSWTGFFQTLSDHDGRFRIKVTGTGGDEQLEVRLTKEGWEPREILNWTLGEANRVVVLDNRTSFTGLVLAPDGSPVADAPIRVDGGPRKLPGASMGESITTGQSGPDGRYRLFVEPGMYEFQVRAPGRGVLRLPGQTISTDETRVVDLPLTAGVTFEARLVNTRTGAPVAGFLIEDWRNKTLSGTSNADGIFTIPSMLPGRFGFGPLRDETFARWWSDACVSEFARYQAAASHGFQRNFDRLEFDLTPGMAPVTIQLEPAAVVRGVVLDPDGKPVAGATVAPALTGTGNSLTGDTRFSVTTDAAGKFTTRLPASGKITYNLIAHDGGYLETRTWANAVGGDLTTTPGQAIEGVTLRLTRPATVTGRVIDASTGQPIANREVEANPDDLRENRYYLPKTRTGPDGTFTLRGVRPGDQFIQAAPLWMDPHDAPLGTTQRVTLAEGETRAGVVLKTTRQER